MGVPGSNPGGPMNLPLLELLPTDPFLPFGEEHRKCSQLRISDGIRGLVESISPPVKKRFGGKLHKSPTNAKHQSIKCQVRHETPPTRTKQTQENHHRQNKHAEPDVRDEKIQIYICVGN